jgi:hypothetical protein
MPIPPTALQNTRRSRRGNHSREDTERSLIRAFATFTQAADSLEKSNGRLQTEVAQFSGEIELRGLLEPFLPRVFVLAPAEVLPGVTVRSLRVIR